MILWKKFLNGLIKFWPITLLVFPVTVFAQELNCKVRVNADQVETTERRIFQDMEVAFEQFLNGKKWTNDTYLPKERIKCNLTITIDQMPSIGSFSATVQIQSARPIYNTNYETILLNFADRDWQFQYTESQPLEFNENSFINNLTSMLAYYAFVILGFDYDSFGELDGTPFYTKAQNIVTNAQQSNRPGWSPLESNRNRFWLAENLTNRQMIDIRKGIYEYHRKALDKFLEGRDESRKLILEVLKDLKSANDINPNQILIISFLDAKSDELVNIFSEGNIQVRREAFNILTAIDPTKRDKYDKIMEN